DTISEPNAVGVGILTVQDRTPNYWVFDQVSLQHFLKGAVPDGDGKETKRALPEDRLVVTWLPAGLLAWLGEYPAATDTQLAGVATDWNDGRGKIKDTFSLKVAVKQSGFSPSAYAHAYSANPLESRSTSSTTKDPIAFDFECKNVK